MSTSKRGATTQWVVSAWTTGGNLPAATVRLQATPSSAGPTFDFGCGSDDGTASCDLGAMDAQSAQRQLQAESKVAATASSVKSVKLTVIGSAADLSQDPSASSTVQISGTVTPTASSSPSPSTSPSPSSSPITTTSPLPVGTLPGVDLPGVNPPGVSSTISPTLSPGGNAGNLFPTLQPSPGSSPPKNVKGRAVADSTALPEGASVLGASLIGLAALALAFVLAVTRFSIRRRPAPSTAGAAAAGTPKAQNAPPDAPAAAAAGGTGAAEAPATKAGDKAPSGAASEPPADASKASADAPKAPEAPADPPADSNPNPGA